MNDLDRNAIHARLIAGGVPESALRGEVEALDWIPRYDGLADPVGCAALAHALAAAVAVRDADGILIGSMIEDAVLAAFVGRELAIPVIRAYVDEGLLLAPQLHGEMRLIVLSDVFRTAASLRALCSLARERGGEPVTVASLYAIDAVGAEEPGVARATLVRVGPPPSP